MKNKLKLSLIAIATLVASNVNAQTYYSCIPQGCPAGQYFDGVKCLSLPNTKACAHGQYFDGKNCLSLCKTNKVWNDGECCNKIYKTTLTFINSKEPLISDKGAKSYDIRSCYNNALCMHDIDLEYGDCVSWKCPMGEGKNTYMGTCKRCWECSNVIY